MIMIHFKDYGINVCDIMEIQEQFFVKWALAPLLSHNIIQVKSNLDEIIILFRSDLPENQIIHTIELMRKGDLSSYCCWRLVTLRQFRQGTTTQLSKQHHLGLSRILFIREIHNALNLSIIIYLCIENQKQNLY